MSWAMIRGGVVPLLFVVCCGCRSGGELAPTSGGGPPLISPAISAVPRPAESPIVAHPEAASRGGTIKPGDRLDLRIGDPPGIAPLQPATPELQPVPSPIQLTAQKAPIAKRPAPQASIGRSAGKTKPASAPRTLAHGSLSGGGPLADVVTPRKQREAARAQSGKNQAAKEPRTLLAAPLKPSIDGKITRLPPVSQNERGSSKRRELPQEPIPIYPEVPLHGVKKPAAGEDL